MECDVPLWATFGGHDVDRLPSASTCYNTLKVPLVSTLLDIYRKRLPIFGKTLVIYLNSLALMFIYIHWCVLYSFLFPILLYGYSSQHTSVQALWERSFYMPSIQMLALNFLRDFRWFCELIVWYFSPLYAL